MVIDRESTKYDSITTNCFLFSENFLCGYKRTFLLYMLPKIFLKFIISISIYVYLYLARYVLQNYSKVSISLPAIFTFELHTHIHTYIRTQKFPLHYEEQFLFNIKFWWVSSWLYIHISSSNLYITYDTYIFIFGNLDATFN